MDRPESRKIWLATICKRFFPPVGTMCGVDWASNQEFIAATNRAAVRKQVA
jgi:hypothetical protein